jgi:hypothetical protein
MRLKANPTKSQPTGARQQSGRYRQLKKVKNK